MNRKSVKLQWLVMLIGIPFFACDNKTDQDFIAIDTNHDFIVFGNVYGECTGDCRTLFLITESGFYEDAGKNTELKNTLFLDEPFPLRKYLTASKLLQFVPENLKNNTFNTTDLIDYIADVDDYVYGQIDGQSFEIAYDEIDSLANPSLYAYCKIVSMTLDSIR